MHHGESPRRHSPHDLIWEREVPVTILVQCETLSSERAVGNSHHVADGVNRGESGRSSRHDVVGRAHRQASTTQRARASGKRRDFSGSRAFCRPRASLPRTALLIVHLCSFFANMGIVLDHMLYGIKSYWITCFRACMQCREQRTSDASFTTRI